MAYLSAASIAAATAAKWVPEAAMNAWPLSVGVAAVILARSATAQKGVYLWLIAAALGLEILASTLSLPRTGVAACRVILFVLALWVLRQRPIREIGSTTDNVRLSHLALAAVVGSLPAAGPWLVVWMSRPAALALNEQWRFGAQPIALGLLSLAGAWAILFVNTVLGEEAGWRGFLLGVLGRGGHQPKVAWGSALLFALWHIPADVWVAEMDIVNLIVNFVTRTLMGVLYVQLFWHLGHSLVPVSVAHASHNFFVYQIVNPRGVLLPRPSGWEGLVIAFGYLLVAGCLVAAMSRVVQRSAPARAG